PHAPPVPPLSLYSLSGFAGPLHSFPTRRSSDLGQPNALLLTTGKLRWIVMGSVLKPNLLKQTQCMCLCFFVGYAPKFNRNHYILDRKSTRLNSSHVKSSYAVFCLKKKASRSNGA